MTNDERVILVENTERSKSNTHQIDEIKARMGKLEEKTEDIHKLAISVEVMSNNVTHMNENQKEGQKVLSDKMDALSEKVDTQNETIKKDVDNKIAVINGKVETIDEEIIIVKNQPAQQIAANVNTVKVAVLTCIATLIVSGIFGAVIHFAK